MQAPWSDYDLKTCMSQAQIKCLKKTAKYEQHTNHTLNSNYFFSGSEHRAKLINKICAVGFRHMEICNY